MKNQPLHYSANKRAFDEVMLRLRQVMRAKLGSVGAMNPEKARSSSAQQDPAKPTSVDFKCDVFKVIAKILPSSVKMTDFHLAYTLYDSETDVDREIHAQSKLGSRRHSIEQRMGAEFIRRKIFPVKGRGGYFFRLRKPRGYAATKTI